MIPLRTRAFWAVYRRVEGAPVLQQPAGTVRAASNRRRRIAGLPGVWVATGRRPRGVAVTDVVTDHGIAARVYRPAGVSGPLPVVVNFHGGGWVSGDVRQSEWWASSVAVRAQVVVVSVEYRLAPEHPFPVPVEDCYSATAWVVDCAADLDVDPARVAVMGDSAGGNLAAAVALMARDRGGPALAYQVLVYPVVDLGRSFASEVENADAPVLTAADVRNIGRLYLSGGQDDPADPYASPLRGELAGLPPALVQTAGHDPLRDQGAAYAEALDAAGVPVRYTNYADAVHGFASLPGVISAAGPALEEAVAALRSALHDAPVAR